MYECYGNNGKLYKDSSTFQLSTLLMLKLDPIVKNVLFAYKIALGSDRFDYLHNKMQCCCVQIDSLTCALILKLNTHYIYLFS